MINCNIPTSHISKNVTGRRGLFRQFFKQITWEFVSLGKKLHLCDVKKKRFWAWRYFKKILDNFFFKPKIQKFHPLQSLVDKQ